MTARRLLTGVLGAAGLIAAVTLLSRLAGFGRWFVQATTIGANPIGTTYATANQVPNVLFEVVAGGALNGAVVPLLAIPVARAVKSDVNRISSALMGWMFVALIPVTAVVWCAAEPIISWLLGSDAGPEFAAQVSLGTELLRVFAWQIPLYGIAVVLGGILQAHKKFFWPPFAPLLSSVVVIISYMGFAASIGGDVGTTSPDTLSAAARAWLGWGTTAGVVALSLPLFIPVWRLGVKLRPTLRFPEGVGKRARNLALAGVGALIAQQLATVAVMRIANTYGTDGTFNIYQYSQALYFLPYAMLAVPLATSSFPDIAQRASERDDAGYSRMVASVTRLVILVSVAGVAVLIAAAPAFQAIFSVRADEGGSMSGMIEILTWMAPGLVGYALIFSLTRALYSRDRSRDAVIATSAGWVAVVIASLLAAMALSGDGPSRESALIALGIGNTVGMTVAGAGLLFAVRQVGGPDAIRGVGRTLAIAAAASVVAVLAGRWVDSLLHGVLTGLVYGIVSAIVVAVVAVGIVVCVAWFVDRGALIGLRVSEGTVESRSIEVSESESLDGLTAHGAIAAPESVGASEIDESREDDNDVTNKRAEGLDEPR